MEQQVLIVDDEENLRHMLSTVLVKQGYRADTAESGIQALERLRDNAYDIVLCDIIMPEKNGYEVCEFIKTADDLKHIPVLLLTGAFEPFDQERAKKAGSDGFLTKPCMWALRGRREDGQLW